MHGRNHRRWLTLPAILLTAGLLATTGCMSSSSSSGGSSVTFAGTGGNLNESFRAAAFEPLKKSEGITVRDDSPNNEAKLKAMVASGAPTWDVFYSSPYRTMSRCGEYFEKIDYSIVDKSKLDPDQVSDCGVPILNSTFLLVYNKKKYAGNPPKSWKDFFDLKKFPGQRGIMNYAKDAGIETALLADGVPADQLYPLDFDRAFGKLDTIRPHTSFLTTGAQQEQALESGQVDMMLAWPGRAYDAARNGADLGVVWKQPLHYFDSLAVVKGSKHKTEAMKLINQMISAPAQTKVAEKLPYTPTNSAADPKPNKLLKQYIAKFNKNGSEITRDNAWWAKHKDEAEKKWTNWVNR